MISILILYTLFKNSTYIYNKLLDILDCMNFFFAIG